MSIDREMTEDYAALSFLAGVFATNADFHFGGHEFTTKIQQEKWDLTWEKLAQWQQEAIDRGIPPEKMIKIPQSALEKMMGHLVKLQRIHDESGFHIVFREQK